MRPEWSWEGDPDQEDGTATYAVGTDSLVLPLPDFKAAYDLATMFTRAYKAGVADGIEHARGRVNRTMQDLSEHGL